MSEKKKAFEVKALGAGVELSILSEIYSWTAEEVVMALAPYKGLPLSVTINSPGGSYFAGLAIYNYIRANFPNATTLVLGLAASAASVIFLAGAKGSRAMARGTFVMIHNPSMAPEGDAKELRKYADTLDQITTQAVELYVRETGLDEATVREMMDAETWLSDGDAIQKGFADAVLELAPAACADLDRFNFRNKPESFGATPEGVGVVVTKSAVPIDPSDPGLDDLDPDSDEENETEESADEAGLEADITNGTEEPRMSDQNAVKIEGSTQAEAQAAALGANVNLGTQTVEQPSMVRDVLKMKTREVLNVIQADDFQPVIVQGALEAIQNENVLRRPGLASIFTIDGEGTLPVPGLSDIEWGAGGETITGDEPAMDPVNFGAFIAQGKFELADEFMDKPFVNIQAMIANICGRSLGQGEAASCFTGNGTGKPQGIFTKTADTTSSDTTPDASEIVTFLDSLDTKYAANAVAIFSPSTLSAIAALTDTTKKIDLDRTGKLLNGIPYIVSSLAPAYAAGNNVIVLGDMARFYGIADRSSGVRVKVVPSTTAASNWIIFWKKVDGRIMDSSAAVVFKIHA